MNKCIICGTHLNRNKAHIQIEYRGERYLVCCPFCQAAFEKDPEKYISKIVKLSKIH